MTLLKDYAVGLAPFQSPKLSAIQQIPAPVGERKVIKVQVTIFDEDGRHESGPPLLEGEVDGP